MPESHTEAPPVVCGVALPEKERADAARVTEKPDATALQRLYLDEVFRYVARRVPAREEAEDIAAETFAAAFAALPKFRGKVPIRAWLLGIARRQIINAHRRNTRRPQVLREYSQDETGASDSACESPAVTFVASGPETLFEREEARRHVRVLMNELKEEQREALLLKYVEELSVNEIAVVMKRSPQSINSLLQRGRKTLYERGKDYFLGSEVTR